MFFLCETEKIFFFWTIKKNPGGKKIMWKSEWKISGIKYNKIYFYIYLLYMKLKTEPV